MTTYLVTGGAGFIGSHLCEALLARGDRVRVLDDLSTGKRENLLPGVELIEGDVADAAIVRRAVDGVAGCFHLAAIASVERGVNDWLGTHRANLTGGITVFDAVRRSKCPVVYASSAAVYGDAATLPIAESTPCRPLSAYGADKYGCELHARVASHVHGIPTVGLRFFNIYGPRQDPSSPYSGVISIFCERIRRGAPVNVFGDGNQTRDFVYVSDVVTALLAAMQLRPSDAPVYNVCTEWASSVLDLARAIAGAAGTKLDIRHPRRAPAKSAIRPDPGRCRRPHYRCASPSHCERGSARCWTGFAAQANHTDRSGRSGQVPLKSVAEALLLPPMSLLVLALAGLLVGRRYRLLGRRMLVLGVVGLLVLAIPIVSRGLLLALEQGLPLEPPGDAPPQAIVILGGDLRRSGDTVATLDPGSLSLERLRDGALLYRQTHLPVLITGGHERLDERSIASVMADTMQRDFLVPVQWIEGQSRDTWENAQFTAAILREHGIKSVYVVTHAWHMRRALMAFSHTGITVTAVPVRSARISEPYLALAFVPNVSSWQTAFFAMHEWVGCAWYAVR
jgi:UDP-glucose 4-epimerase